jgi:hypothetical protein
MLDMQDDVVPRLTDLRRIPVRYRHILPLEIMKRHQCVVVGAARGVLTVAIADPQNTSVLEVLRKYTRHAIFPVWIEPVRMHLLIHRIECRRGDGGRMPLCNSRSVASQIHTIMTVLMVQMEKINEQERR